MAGEGAAPAKTRLPCRSRDDETLRREDYQIGHYRVRQPVKHSDLVVWQHAAYKVTTVRKRDNAVADSLLNHGLAPN